MEAWREFFLGELGASAALAGLLFVALSINLESILAIAGMAERGAQALVLLLAIVVISSFGLAPMPLQAFGISVTVGAFAFLAFSWFLESRAIGKADPRHRRFRIFNTGMQQLALAPYVVAGIMLALEREAGAYWLLAGVIVSFVKAVADAWVLLVEIKR